jgi:rare lipoprotein A
MDLGTLEINFIGSFQQLDRDIARAKTIATQAAKEIESSFKNTNFKITVNDSALSSLNKHLDFKKIHFQQVQQYFNQNPLTVKVDDTSLTKLNKELDIITKQRDVVVNVKANIRQEAELVGTEVGQQVKKSLSNSFKGLGKEVKDAVSLNSGITLGIGQLFGSMLGSQMISGLKRNLGVDVKAAIGSIFDTAAKPLKVFVVDNQDLKASINKAGVLLEERFESAGYKVGEAIIASLESKASTIEGKFNAFTKELIDPNKFQSQLSTLKKDIVDISSDVKGSLFNKQASQEFFGGLGEKISSRREKGLQTRAVPLVRERALQILEENKARNSANAVTSETEQIYIATGGYAGARGLSGKRLAGDLKKQISANDLAIWVKNDDTDLPKEAMSKAKEKAIALMTSMAKPHLRGYSKDAIEMAAQAMAALEKNPNVKVKFLGESGGGFAAEEAEKIVSLMGYGQKADYLGVGTPQFIGGLDSRNRKIISPDETLGAETHKMYAKLGLANVSSSQQNILGVFGHPYENYKEAGIAELQNFIQGMPKRFTSEDISGAKGAAQAFKAHDLKKLDSKQLEKFSEQAFANLQMIRRQILVATTETRQELEEIAKDFEDVYVASAPESREFTQARETIAKAQNIYKHLVPQAGLAAAKVGQELAKELESHQKEFAKVGGQYSGTYGRKYQSINSEMSDLIAKLQATELGVKKAEVKIPLTIPNVPEKAFVEQSAKQVSQAVAETAKQVIENTKKEIVKAQQTSPNTDKIKTQIAAIQEAIKKSQGYLAGTPELSSAYIDTILKVVPEIQKQLNEAIQSLPTEERMSSELGVQLANLKSQIPSMQKRVAEIVKNLNKDITRVASGEPKDSIKSLGNVFTEQLRTAKQFGQGSTQGDALAKDVLAATEKARQSISDLLVSFGQDVPEVIKKAAKIARQQITTSEKGAKTFLGEAKTAGLDTGAGFNEGLKQSIANVQKSAQAMAQIAIDVTEETLEIQSPSKVFERIGRFVGQGFKQGLDTIGQINFKQLFQDLIDSPADSIDKLLGNFSKLSGAAKAIAVAFAGFTVFQLFGSQLIDFGRSTSQVASNLENLERRIKFVSNSSADANKNLEFFRGNAKRLGSDISTSLTQGGAFAAVTRGSSLEGDPTRRIVGAVQQASTVLGATPEQQERGLLALQQMAGKTIVSQEELRQQLSEAIPGAAQVAARAYGLTTQEMNQLIEKGQILAEDFLPRLAQQLSIETSAGLPGALKTSVYAMGRFKNATLEAQESIGKLALPLQTFSLNVLSGGIEKLTGMLPLLINGFQFFILLITKPFWFPIIQGLFSIQANTLLTGISFKTLGASIATFSATALTALAPLLLQFLAFEAVILIFSALKEQYQDFASSIRDNTKQINQSIDELNKSLNKVGTGAAKPLAGNTEELRQRLAYEYNDKIQKNPFSVFSTTRVPVQIKELEDYLSASKELLATSQRLKKESESSTSTKAISDLKLLDAEYQRVQNRRRGLEVNNPGDAKGREALIAQEQDLLRKREEANRTPTTYQTAYATQAKTIKDLIELMEEQKKKGVVTAESEIQLQKLKKGLVEVTEKQEYFAKSTRSSQSSLLEFERSFARLDASLEGTKSRLESLSNISKVTLQSQEASGAITPGQNAFTDSLKQQEQISKQVAANISVIRQKYAELNNQNALQVLNDLGIDKNSTSAELKGRAEENQANPQVKSVLEKLAQVRDLEAETYRLNAQQAEQQNNLVKQIYDSNKAVLEYYQSIQRQTQELSIAAQEAAQTIKLTNVKSKLKAAISGTQDNFVNQFVDSIVQITESLGQIANEEIQAKRQILQNENAYKDIIKQGVDLNRNLPGLAPGATVGSYTGGYNQSLVFPIGGRNNSTISSGYGDRVHPISGKHKFHDGVDYPAPIGTSVVSPMAGVVVGVKYEARGGGKYVVIESLDSKGQKVEHTFMHLDQQMVKEGQQVAAGQQVGTVGNTGGSTGPHLHYRTRINGRSVNPIDFLKSGTLGAGGGGGQIQTSSPSPYTGSTKASFYGAGDGFDGKPTASGETFDQNKMTAAINETLRKQLGLNFGTQVQITNPATGQSVVVRVNDHGPYEKKGGKFVPHSTRGFDLSTSAARAIGLDKVGVGNVNFRVLGQGGATGSPNLNNSRAYSSASGLAQGQSNPGGVMIGAGGKVALDNLNQQNAQVIAKFEGSRKLAQLDAERNARRAQSQLETNRIENLRSTKATQRNLEDSSLGLGYQTYGVEATRQAIAVERKYEDQVQQLQEQRVKQQEAIDTAESTLAVLRSSTDAEIPYRKEYIQKLEKLLPSVKAVLGQINKQILDSAEAESKEIGDIEKKSYEAEMIRLGEAKDNYSQGRSEILKRNAANRRTLAERSRLSIPDLFATLDAEKEAASLDASVAYNSTIRAIDEQIKKEINKDILKLLNSRKAQAFASLLKAPREAQQRFDRELLDRQLTERGEHEGRLDKISESRKSLLSAGSQYLGRFNLGTIANPLNKKIAQMGAEDEYRRGSLEIEQLAASGKYSNEQLSELRKNLESLNTIKLENIRAEFDVWTGVMESTKGQFEGFFGSMIRGTASIGEAFSNLIGGIADNLANLAAQYLTNEIFASIFGISNKPAIQESGGGGLLGGGIGGILGGLLGFANGGEIGNYANGGIIGAMQRERAMTGRRAHLIVASEGERILNHKEAQIWNKITGRLNFASGGMIGADAGTLSASAGVGGGLTINVPINVGSESKGAFDKGKEAALKQAIIATVVNERRPGGSLYQV